MGNIFKPQAVLFAGCGNMGSAILDGALKNEVLKASEVTILDNFESEKILAFQSQGVSLYDVGNALDDFDVIILAVKPQDSDVIMKSLGSSLTSTGLVISIMAGVNISTMESFFKDTSVIRAMPNTPCGIGEGATGFAASSHCSEEQITWAKGLFDAFGQSVFCEQEGMIDAVTSISGSGPAYLFYLAEAMTEQAKKLGFSTENAKILVNQTLKGASLLLDQSSDSASELRAKVTSKGGTTFAATEEFDAQGVKEGIKSGIQKAFERSKELGS